MAGIFNGNSSLFIVIAIVVFIAFLLLIARVRVKKSRLRREWDQQMQTVIRHLKSDSGLEKNVQPLLQTLTDVALANNCAFYMRQPGSTVFTIQAVHREDPDEQLKFPKSLEVDESLQYVGIVDLGHVLLFNLPIGDFGLARLGPMNKISRARTEQLISLGDTLTALVDLLIEFDRLFKKADLIETSRSALQAISTMSMNQEAIIRQTFKMSASALGISGGCMLVEERGVINAPLVFGYSDSTNAMLTNNDNRQFITKLIAEQELVIWDTGEERFSEIKSIAGSLKNGQIIAGYLPWPTKKAWFVCILPRISSSQLPPDQVKTAMGMMTAQLQGLLAVQEQMQPFSPTYGEFLKMLVRTMDNLNPFTTGYSEMLSRYAITIAQQLGLPQQQIRDIGTAAYLSRVGMLGISENLYMKDSQANDSKMNTMRLHAEVGAVIIETTLGNETVANYIRYQYEHVDGSGYPKGLAKEDIPIGSRIIAVANTFLSCIHGRKHREPLTFDEAIRSMLSLAGTRLDEDIVQRFVGWFEHKRQGVRLSGRALGVCWEMNCSPSAVCNSCPAYNRRDVNCWDFGTNNCQSHGKTCKTCFVYTETHTRNKVTVET